MKRSDMIKILADSYWKYMNSSDPEVDTDLKLHSRVLQDLEDAGMLQPGFDSGLYDRTNCENYFINDWEQEGEE